MPLNFEIDSIDDVPESVREFYTEHQSGKYRLSVEGVKPLDEFNTVYKSLGAAKEDTRKYKDILHKFGDHTPESVEALQDKIAELEARTGELDDEKIEKIVNARLSPTARELEKANQTLSEREARIAELESTLVNRDRQQKINELAADKIKPEFIRDAQLRAQIELKHNAETGDFTDEYGASAEEWFYRQLKDTPGWVLDSTSGGARGGKGADARVNPFDKNSPHFNMTEAAKLMRTDPKRARALAAEAGIDIPVL